MANNQRNVPIELSQEIKNGTKVEAWYHQDNGDVSISVAPVNTARGVEEAYLSFNPQNARLAGELGVTYWNIGGERDDRAIPGLSPKVFNHIVQEGRRMQDEKPPTLQRVQVGLFSVIVPTGPAVV